MPRVNEIVSSEAKNPVWLSRRWRVNVRPDSSLSLLMNSRVVILNEVKDPPSDSIIENGPFGLLLVTLQAGR